MVRIEEAETDRLGDVVAIWNTCYPDMLSDLEQVLHNQQAIEPKMRSRYWLAVHGKSVGMLELSPVPGSYDPKRWMIHLCVLPDFRRQGIGAELYDLAVGQIGPEAPLSIATTLLEDDSESLEFACKRGYQVVKRDFQSVLDLTTIDYRLLEKLAEAQLPPGVQIKTAAEMDSLEFRRSMHALFEEVRKDIPRTLPPTPLSFELFDQQILANPAVLLEGTQVAFAGNEMVGFCWLFRGAAEGRLDQALTAVRKDLRGQGIASAMKGKAMQWAVRAGFTHVRTDNDTRNFSMLAINEKLGYQRLPGTISVMWEPTDQSS